MKYRSLILTIFTFLAINLTAQEGFTEYINKHTGIKDFYYDQTFDKIEKYIKKDVVKKEEAYVTYFIDIKKLKQNNYFGLKIVEMTINIGGSRLEGFNLFLEIPKNEAELDVFHEKVLKEFGPSNILYDIDAEEPYLMSYTWWSHETFLQIEIRSFFETKKYITVQVFL